MNLATKKNIPATNQQILEFVKEYETPFYIYDEKGIREGVRKLTKAFAWAPDFKEYFAVKACPIPGIIQILKEEGCGTDCSSIAELIISEKLGIVGEDIMFTSNNTPVYEYQKAIDLGAVLNLDDFSHIDYVQEHIGLPELVSFRYNPGEARAGNAIIGNPREAKYGFTKEQLLEGYKKLKGYGVKRFGLHTMVASNELNIEYFYETARMLFGLMKEIKEETGCEIELIDMGGGIGIPYKPEDTAIDLEVLGAGVQKIYQELVLDKGMALKRLSLECGRLITGPHGYLITKAIHYKNTYKNYIGVDACMANLMRPALYGSYHHIVVVGKENEPCDHVYDVTGSLCENNDKFAIDRMLPKIDIGDFLVIHDTGAHGFSMGYNYNGKLKSAELLLKEDGSVELIRRAETPKDYFATLDCFDIYSKLVK